MYEAAVAAQPDNARFHALLAASYVALFNRSREAGALDEAWMERAEMSYRRSLKLNPIHGYVMDNLARILIRKGEFAEAAGLLRDALDTVDDQVKTLQALGYCYYRLGEDEAAVRAYEKIWTIAPGADLGRYYEDAKARAGR